MKRDPSMTWGVFRVLNSNKQSEIIEIGNMFEGDRLALSGIFRNGLF